MYCWNASASPELRRGSPEASAESRLSATFGGGSSQESQTVGVLATLATEITEQRPSSRRFQISSVDKRPNLSLSARGVWSSGCSPSRLSGGAGVNSSGRNE